MFGIGPQELFIILVIALVVVGPRKLPEMARSIGKGLREVRKAQDEVRKTIQVDLDEEPQPSRGGEHRASPAAAGATEPGVEGSDTATTDPATTGAAAGTAATAAGGAAATDPVKDVSRSLGRGLAELRKAREEIQRTFRVDLGDVTGAAPTRPSPATSRPSPAAPAEAAGSTGEPGTTEAPAEPTEEPVPESQAPAAE